MVPEFILGSKEEIDEKKGKKREKRRKKVSTREKEGRPQKKM